MPNEWSYSHVVDFSFLVLDAGPVNLCFKLEKVSLKLITWRLLFFLLQLNRDPEGYRSTVPIADNGSRQSEFLYALNSISKLFTQEWKFFLSHRVCSRPWVWVSLEFLYGEFRRFLFYQVIVCVWSISCVLPQDLWCDKFLAHSPDSF